MHPLLRRIQGKVLTTGLSLVVFVTIACFIAHSYRFLSINKPVASQIMVVEGWLDEQSLLQARDIFNSHDYRAVITTGIPHTEGYKMGSGGKAVFNLHNLLHDSVPAFYKICLLQSGTSVYGIFPRFRIWIDSTEIAVSYSEKRATEYACQADISSPVHTITVVFDNDEVSAWRDRNFYFYTLTVNNRIFHPGNCEVSYFIRKGGKYYFKKQYKPDTANDALHYLAMNGIPVSSISSVVTAKQVKLSRTYSTATDVKSYLEALYPERIPSVTVVTRGIHARRTWISYQKAFGKDTAIGIISLPDNKLTSKNWWKSLKGWKSMVYEITGLMYASIAL